MEQRTEQPETRAEDTDRSQIIFTIPQVPGSGPPCIWDNGPTQKTGSCFTCLLCGSTTSCG